MDKKKNIIKKTTFLNIDSRYRNKDPSNVVESNLKLLDTNPISVTADSNLVKINYPSHNLSVKDKILIQNIEGKKKKLSTPFYLINNFDYMLVNFDDHNLSSNYLKYQDNFQVEINMISELTSTDYLIGNIPINSLLGIRDIYLCSAIETVPDNLIDSLDITADDLENNYFLVKLPFNYKSDGTKYKWSDPELIEAESEEPIYPVNKLTFLVDERKTTGAIDDIIEDLNEEIIEWEHPYAFIISGDDSNAYWLVGEEIADIYIIDKIIEISFLNIGNIPLPYLNSNYPINYNQFQGFQEIIKVEDDFIYFYSKIKSFSNETSGGSKVNVSKILDSLTGYPSSNSYKILLKNNFVNVSSIELVNVSIPYVDNIIISLGDKKNNMLYWKQFEDGNIIYSIEIPEGDYTQISLQKKLLSLLNKVERINSTLKNPVFNLFEIDLNVKEMDFKIKGYCKHYLPDSITVDTVEIDDETFYRLTIVHSNNLVEVGDSITIEGSTQIGVVLSQYINKSHKVYSIDKLNNKYVVLINHLNISSNDVEGNGGNDIIIKTKSLFSLLFDQPNTIGNILGFKNVGIKNSVTEFSSIIKNCCNYKYSKKINSVGIEDTKKNIVTLSYYEKDYFLLFINDLETIDNNGNIPSCFAKILIDDILCKEFISNKYVTPIPSLNELDITFLNPDGSLTDFRNVENSFVLKVVEDLAVNNCTGINSKVTSYN